MSSKRRARTDEALSHGVEGSDYGYRQLLHAGVLLSDGTVIEGFISNEPELVAPWFENALIESFLAVIRNGGGKVEKVDTWGRRRLSYEINKKPEGIYSVIDLNANPEVVKELDRQLNLNESVLRTKVLRPEMH